MVTHRTRSLWIQCAITRHETHSTESLRMYTILSSLLQFLDTISKHLIRNFGCRFLKLLSPICMYCLVVNFWNAESEIAANDCPVRRIPFPLPQPLIYTETRCNSSRSCIMMSAMHSHMRDSSTTRTCCSTLVTLVFSSCHPCSFTDWSPHEDSNSDHRYQQVIPSCLSYTLKRVTSTSCRRRTRATEFSCGQNVTITVIT